MSIQQDIKIEKDFRKLWRIISKISREIEEVKKTMVILQYKTLTSMKDIRKELKDNFPDSRFNPGLLRLVGSEPYLPIEDEKGELISILERRYNSEENLG